MEARAPFLHTALMLSGIFNCSQEASICISSCLYNQLLAESVTRGMFFFSFYTRLFPRLKSSLYTVMALVTKPTGQSTVICIIGAHALPNARMGTLIISFGLRGPHFPGKQTLPGAHWLHVNTCLIPVEQISYISTYSTGIKSIDLQSRSAQLLIKLSFV